MTSSEHDDSPPDHTIALLHHQQMDPGGQVAHRNAALEPGIGPRPS